MKKIRFLYALAAAALLLAACASSPRAASSGGPLPTDSNIHSGKLANGMSWFVAKNSEPGNRLFLRLAVKAGSSLEDNDQRGIAHLVEHMCFNGTEHFAKDSLVDYFESIGMKFGPEVNAYTSFDETVYELEIPADDPVILEKSLLVLHDWASSVSFDQDELDKERGVVIEEWRLGRGASGRVEDKEIPFLLNGSRYGERQPIGDPEIIKTVTRARVLDFYKKWYRPDLMSVVIVGDADPVMLSRRIETVMGSIPAAAKPAARPAWKVALQKEPSALVIRDPEIQYTTVQLMEQYPSDRLRTESDLRAKIARIIAYGAFNARLSEKIHAADPVLLAGRAGIRRLVAPTQFSYTGMVPVNGKFDAGLDQTLEELARFEKYGVTDAELERAKGDILDSVKQMWLDREKYHSANYIDGIMQSILYAEPPLSIQDEYDLYNKIVPTITAKEVGESIRKWYTGTGKLLLVTAPENAQDVPDGKTLLAQWQNWKPKTELAAYAEHGLERPLVSEIPVPGKIVKEEKIAASGIKQWTLSNGARVLVYPTAFKTNEILFSAWSKGGSSLSAEKDYPSAAVATSYARMSGLNGFSATDLQKKLSGKTVSAGPWIDESWEGLYGSSSAKDMETLLQLVNLDFTAPSFTDEGWKTLSGQLNTVAESRANNPDEMFADLSAKLLYGDSVRHSNLTPSLVARMDRAKAEAAYRARYADAGDFTFAFVGSVDEAKLKGFVETWLASLPSSGKKEEAADVAVPFPSGQRDGSINMGIEQKARVMIAFGGSQKIASGDLELFDMMCSVLEIKLRETIREDMSGSYGVQVQGSIVNYPAPHYEIRIEFGCDPARTDELSKAVLDQVKWMQGAPVDEKYVTKMRETYKRSQEEGLKNNEFWIREISSRSMTGRSLDGITATDAVLAQITGERFRDMARAYFSADNYVRATLLPKK
jgi:zinc protease